MTRRSLLTSLFALLLLSAAVMVFMALVATKPGATAKPPQERAWTVTTSTVAPGPHQPTPRSASPCVATLPVHTAAALAGAARGLPCWW